MIARLADEAVVPQQFGQAQLALDRRRVTGNGRIAAHQDFGFTHGARSSMCRHGVGEQQVVDMLLEPAGAAVLARDLIDVDDLGLDPAGMRRQQQDAVADLDGFGDRMGDEQHVNLVSSQSCSSSSCILRRVSASSAANGSSISRMSGSIAMPRAIATRCFMPPDSVCG